jgi:pimeloyl-ACP methyl ester carboxylesterase
VIVLVHGCGTSHHLWDELRRELSLPSIAVTLPGRPPTHGEVLPSASEAATWLREQIRGEHAIVVGHSFGGAIAIEYALQSPPELAGIVLVSTGARLRVLPAILDVTAAAARTGEPADLGSYAYIEDTAVVARMRALDREVPPATTAGDWQACNRFDRLRNVANIRTRTLVVTGTADTLTPPRYGQYLADAIPGARMHLVPGAGHMLPVEHAPALARALETFYSDSGAPPDAAT